MIKFLSRSLIIIGACLCACMVLYAQSRDTTRVRNGKDSTINSFVIKMQAFAKTSARKSADEFAADKATLAQNSIFKQIKKTVHKAKIYLKTNVDTIGTRAQLEMTEKNFVTAGNGVFTNKGKVQTFRNLTATAKILTELLNKANTSKAWLDRHQEQLIGFRH
ncbi:hypothetical protein [Pedobacter hartonius]|uniref:Uncharacterized protein n=1 Tax=Pedobacter hartonius TaxID=425514 RepID=A0A1H4BBB8_9SPHI|nr:hypothetical protein [Pedobacter hartonius]SEA45439.1 hypothetical protein SAMN05443550_103278 [Pedobacter hartonius]